MANNSYWSKRVNCSYWSEAANFSYINRTADPSYQASSTNLAYKTNSSSKLYRYPLESDRRETEAQHLFFYLFKDSVSGTLVVQQVCLTCSWQTPVLPSASLSLFPQCQAPDLASRWKRTNWFRRDECRSPSSCLEASRKIEFHQASATTENIQATENRSELVLFFILGLPPPHEATFFHCFLGARKTLVTRSCLSERTSAGLSLSLCKSPLRSSGFCKNLFFLAGLNKTRR